MYKKFLAACFFENEGKLVCYLIFYFLYFEKVESIDFCCYGDLYFGGNVKWSKFSVFISLEINKHELRKFWSQDF